MATISAENACNQTAPFTCNVLEECIDPEGELTKEFFLEGLAASYRFGDDLVAPTHLERRFVEQELELNRIHSIMRYLWMAGRPVPPRPLYYQLILGRELVITERMDMHMVWGQGRIFLKPIPRFLLSSKFWETNLPKESVASDNHIRSLRGCALGFLVSYTALIAHESDFYIARQKYLIPEEVSFKKWKIFVRDVLRSSNNIQSEVADRFVYGELRLNRLNLISMFLGSFKGYLPQWNTYSSFYRDNLQLVVASTVSIVVVLNAMQVGLSTSHLSNNDTFQAVSYGFTVLSILGPSIAVIVLVLVFCFAFVVNWRWAEKNERKRLQVLGRSWSTQKKEGV